MSEAASEIRWCPEGHSTRAAREGERKHNCGCVDLGIRPEHEQVVRAIVREEIAAYFASVSRSGVVLGRETQDTTKLGDECRTHKPGPYTVTVNMAGNPDDSPDDVYRKVLDALARARPTTYREYLHTRDEPPAAPPVRPAPNTTERL